MQLDILDIITSMINVMVQLPSGVFLLTATYHTMPPVFLFSEMFFLIYFSAVKVNSFGCASSPSVESSHLET